MYGIRFFKTRFLVQGFRLMQESEARPTLVLFRDPFGARFRTTTTTDGGRHSRRMYITAYITYQLRRAQRSTGLPTAVVFVCTMYRFCHYLPRSMPHVRVHQNNARRPPACPATYLLLPRLLYQVRPDLRASAHAEETKQNRAS